MDDDVTAREINAEPWEPPAGMVKCQCRQCLYWSSIRDSMGPTSVAVPAPIRPYRPSSRDLVRLFERADRGSSGP